MHMIQPRFNAEQAHHAIRAMWETVKGELLQGRKHVVELKPATRSNEQNALLHAHLSEIARTHDWAGSKRDIDTWKRLLTAAWLRARGESVEILPALDGHGVDVVFRRTSQMTVGEMSELIEYVLAWRAMKEAA